MRLNLKNLILVFAPIVVVSILDLGVKKMILNMMTSLDYGFLRINVAPNKGIIDGFFSGVAKPIYQIPMVTFGCFLLVVLYFVQLFAPVKSNLFRFSISLFFAGIFANVVDRFLRGYVVDYLSFNIFGRWTPAWNLADLLQIVGIVLIFVLQFRPSTFDENYGSNLWVSPQFQRRYSLQLMKMGFFLVFILGVLSYAFVRVSFDQMSTMADVKKQLLFDYEIFFVSTAITFLLLIFLIGKALSAHVVKPILNFEQYLRNLSAGQYSVFKVDEPEFQYLEKLSDNVRDHLVEMRLKLARLEARTNTGTRRDSGND